MISLNTEVLLRGAKSSNIVEFEPAAIVCNAQIPEIPAPDNVFLDFIVENPISEKNLNTSVNEVQVEPIEIWDEKQERLFSRLAELEAVKKLDSKQTTALERLTRLRRQLKNPRSGEEVIAEFEQRVLTRSLVQALTEYVRFHATKNPSQ